MSIILGSAEKVTWKTFKLPCIYSESLKARHRKQISERRSNGLKEYYKTHPAPNLGIPHTEETKRKISESCIKSGVGKWNLKRKQEKD